MTGIDWEIGLAKKYSAAIVREDLTVEAIEKSVFRRS
jgi:hypothetical protein